MTLATQLADPLTAKKKFIDSLTHFKKYLDDVQESSAEMQVNESRVVRPTFTMKRERSVPRVRKVKPTIRKQTIVAVDEQAIEVEPEIASEVQVEESRVVRPTFTMKRGRSVPRVRKVKPTIRKRKKMLVFTVQEVVAEEESSFEPEVVAEEEITPEKFVNMDIDKLSDDDFYKIFHFLKSEKRKLDGVAPVQNPSWIKYSHKLVD
jgi:hypothetical protein